MYKYSGIIVLVVLIFVQNTSCGIFGRNVDTEGVKNDATRYGAGSGSKNLDNGKYSSGSLNNGGAANGNVGAGSSSCISAWGLIALILFIILLGMLTYYAALCYPLFCKQERNYDMMDAGSDGAPTTSTEYEKSGNYSSRSTTPSKSNE